MAKDLFSSQSKLYAQFRPAYPQDLFEYILQFVEERKCAWDCATGNGQAAKVLAGYFEKVMASDISEAQLANAIKRPTIEYHKCPAEETPFAPNSFDLVTVAQAYHWLSWKNFHLEATRVGKHKAVIAIWTYNLPVCEDGNMNRLVQHFYRDITGAYWDYERRYVDDGYSTVEFDFAPLPPKNFLATFHWSREQFTGFIQSWSAVQNYIKKNGENPVDLIEKELNTVWKGDELKEMHFPIFLRMGRILK